MVFTLGLAGLTRSATTVSLGNANNFAILAGSGITIAAPNATTITGDIGSYGTATTITGMENVTLIGLNQAGNGTTQLAKTDLTTAYGTAEGQTLPSVTTVTASGVDSFGGGTINNGAALTPGIYKSASSMGVTGTLVLNGGGDPNAVFIFQAVSSLTTAASSIISLTNGTQACNVFWQVGSTATLGGVNSIFNGNILALTDINLGTTATVNGRVLARNGAVTLAGTNTITVAKCLPRLTVTKTVNNINGGTKGASDFSLLLDGFSVTSGVASTTTAGLHTVSETADAGYTAVIGGDCAPTTGTITLAAGDVKACSITNTDVAPAAASQRNNTLTVIKHVINDNGRTAKFSDFPLFVNGQPVTSGESINLAPGIYTVTETNLPNYKRTFSGDCNANGQVNHGGVGTYNSVCIITNDDIGAPVVVPPVPPLIDLVKTASPLSLPAGPGSVEYTYTLRNVGTVPVTDITIVGDTCSPIILASGDTNGNSKLEVNETWVHTCTQALSETHTNTAVATGWANGISAVDIASATVVVGVPVVPPLIHVTKIPNPLALRAGGGMVTYYKKITNPGTVPLNNVHLTDDKCSPVKYISGDTDKDARLDTNETWVYTCKVKLAKTTINTAIATGEANGLTARDIAVATVVVANAVVPKFPKTGLPSTNESTPWGIVMLSGILVIASISLVVVKRKRTI